MSENNVATDNAVAINYEDYVLDPSKDVLVPMSTYIALTNVIQEVERKHSNRIRTDKYAWYNKQTHQKLSAKGKAKMSQEKLLAEYYENIDMDETAKNVRVDRDELGSAAVQLLGEFRGIFKYNVDAGNGVLRSEVAPPPAPPLAAGVNSEAPAPVTEAPVAEEVVEDAAPETVTENDS